MARTLTEAQRRELDDLAGREGAQHYDDAYRPIKRLLELGYVERKPARFGGNLYTITPAGRAVLTAEEDKP